MHNADRKVVDEDGRNLLMLGCAERQRSIVILLLKDGGIDLHQRDSQGMTVLMHAAAGGDIELVKLFLSTGADIHARDYQGRTALMIAAKGKELENDDEAIQLDVVKLLLAHKADPTETDAAGKAALDHAKEGDLFMGHRYVNKSIVKLLSECCHGRISR